MPDHFVPEDGSPQAPPLQSASGAEALAPAVAPSAGSQTGETPHPSVAELERVRARDPEALAAFFERYVDRVFGLVYRLLGDRTLAEDMTQDVFLKVHRAAHQLDPRRDPRPWIMTIAHNACRDLWRSAALTCRISGPASRGRPLRTVERHPERSRTAGPQRC